MLPRRILDGMTTPDGRELELSQRGDDFLIQIDRCDLMSSRCHGSEDAMARLVLEAGAARGRVRWLVGGLGMGFTLRACLDALDRCAPGSSVVVAEVFEAVVQWNQTLLGHLADQPLADPRSQVVVTDVFEYLASSSEAFDAILLDVDNGPEALTLESNHRIYASRGLLTLHEKLRNGGVLAVWSASRDRRFEKRLSQAGFAVDCRQVRARPGKGERHTIFLARARPGKR
ncbi:MAG: hypothetical protein AAGC60_14305 [Acidobacteriota bacterium]